MKAQNKSELKKLFKATVEAPEERPQVEEEDIVKNLTVVLKDLSTTEVKGEDSEPKMAEPEVNKLALFMEDMKARMKAMEAHTATLQDQLDQTNQENINRG